MHTNIDVIILSYGKSDSHKALTTQTLETLLLSEDVTKISFNVIVIESNKSLAPFQYENSKTLYPRDDFGFNKYLNIGINLSKNEFICLANNDLIFKKHWASEMLNIFKNDKELLSANPFCCEYSYKETVDNGPEIMFNKDYPNTHGILTGWCIFVKRDVFKIIGKLDERFKFWYADNDYELTLKKFNIKHGLIKSSKVTHLGNRSHDTLEQQFSSMTYDQKKVFEKKWVYKTAFNYYYSKISFKIKNKFKKLRE